MRTIFAPAPAWRGERRPAMDGGMTAALTADEALDEFRAAGALLEGHFILSSGLHSPVFLQKMFVFQDPARTERLCRALAAKAREAFGPIDVVASPAVGGIVPGYETARWLGAKAIFVERENGAFKLRRGFSIAPRARVLMVEDIITTGLSSRECLEALREHPGTDRRRGLPDRPLGRPGGDRRAPDRPGDARHSGLRCRRAAAGAGGAAGGEAGKPGARRRSLRQGSVR